MPCSSVISNERFFGSANLSKCARYDELPVLNSSWSSRFVFVEWTPKRMTHATTPKKHATTQHSKRKKKREKCYFNYHFRGPRRKREHQREKWKKGKLCLWHRCEPMQILRWQTFRVHRFICDELPVGKVVKWWVASARNQWQKCDRFFPYYMIKKNDDEMEAATVHEEREREQKKVNEINCKIITRQRQRGPLTF